MKYDLLPEFQKYSWLRMPVQPVLLKAANRLMPVIQHGKKLDSRLSSKTIHIGEFTAKLIQPNDQETDAVLIYYHGGAFVLKAAAYHKNLAQAYALQANCAVLFVDYRLAPKYQFPVPAMDCFEAYCWALENFPLSRLAVGGDSAGADLAMSVMLMARDKGKRMPDGQMLIYPGAASRPDTASMQRFQDTPMWNSVLNEKALDLYADRKERDNPLLMPLLTETFSGFPPAYLETTEFDCLHDAGVQIAERYGANGVEVVLNETTHTMHGYDIAENSPYVKEQVRKRIAFLTDIFKQGRI